MKTVLVTGVGAIIGYGILRSLRETGDDLHLIAADIYPDAVGQAWSDSFEIAPLTASNEYLPWLKKLIEREGVDLLIPGIEQDSQFLSDHREEFGQLEVAIALNNRRLINVAGDKWLMYQELVRLDNDTRIESQITGDFDVLSERLGLPFLLKPRCGYASKGIIRVSCESEFSSIADQLGSNLIAQPMVGSDEEEYTVGIFGDGAGNVSASITLQRRLAKDGSTSKARVRADSTLDEAVSLLCEQFKPIGPTNLQFRRDGKDWKLLEINPRISSSTSIRSAFGYNEADMCLKFYLKKERIAQPYIRRGFAVRYIEDWVRYDCDNL